MYPKKFAFPIFSWNLKVSYTDQVLKAKIFILKRYWIQYFWHPVAFSKYLNKQVKSTQPEKVSRKWNRSDTYHTAGVVES